VGMACRRAWTVFLALASCVAWTADSNAAVFIHPPLATSGQHEKQNSKGDLQESFKVKVESVVVDVVVRNKRGVFVGDLQPDEFRIYDNGVSAISPTTTWK